MPLKGLQYGAQQLDWAEAMARALDDDDSFPYPPQILRAMMDNRDDEIPSASSMAGCLRRFELKRSTDYYAEPKSLLPMLFGTAWHLLMEKYSRPEDGVVEQHLIGVVETGLPSPYDRLAVQGTPDNAREGAEVLDWKSKGFIPQGWRAASEHRAQANVYNWLRVQAGHAPLPKWRLVYVSQSWIHNEAGDMQPVEVTQAWLQKRLRRWARAKLENRLPEPLPTVLDTDDKNRPVGECRYCEVRQACLAAMRQEGGNHEPFGD